jgi:hypothetical protein
LAPQPIVIRHVNFMIAKQCQANNFFLTGTALCSDCSDRLASSSEKKKQLRITITVVVITL